MVTLRHPPQGVRSGPVLEPYQVILRPLITEKATHVSERHNAYTFEEMDQELADEIRKAQNPAQSQSPLEPNLTGPRPDIGGPAGP